MCVYVQVFLNIVLDEAVEEKAGGEKVRIGMVVCRVVSSTQYPIPIPTPIHGSRRDRFFVGEGQD